MEMWWWWTRTTEMWWGSGGQNSSDGGGGGMDTRNAVLVVAVAVEVVDLNNAIGRKLYKCKILHISSVHVKLRMS